MFDSIKRDTDKARKADGGSFITQTGEYVVWIGQPQQSKLQAAQA